ncbi:MAG: hypothetical protein GHCLOJNM_02566 [bacterium]|nr:hypothetical protein [bacterium]
MTRLMSARPLAVLLFVALLPVARLRAEEAQSPFVHAHAHNDYEHPRPLSDALDHRFYSVEADIWLVEGRILVAHDEGEWKGTLKDLYLDPLQARVREKGSVHGDGNPFLLWIDLKDGRPELNQELEDLLAQYPMLTVFTDEEMLEGPVTAILTGDAESKTRHVAQFPRRRVCRDGTYSAEDSPADNRWRWVALRWGSFFDWRGEGEIPPEEHAKLTALVNDIHAKGRKLRFWGNPDKESYWRLALATGIDLINTDRLAELETFLAAKAANRP